MQSWQRYAIYYTAIGNFAEFGAKWLGRDIVLGRNIAHTDLDEITSEQLERITRTPRRYGFHATLKPPFHLATGTREATLRDDLSEWAANQSPVLLSGGLQLALLHGFPALIPTSPSVELTALASSVVKDLDHHRAPLTEKDRARRNPEQLTTQQRANLDQWGYPWVMDDFRFHMTLGDRLSDAEGRGVIETLRPIVSPLLTDPFAVDAITLVGEDSEGAFHQIARFQLTGK